MDLVEKVARAICAVDGVNPDLVTVGLGNIMPGLLRRLIDRPDLAARLLPAIQAVDDLVSAEAFVPGVKAVVATLTGQATWRQVTPPLAPLGESEAAMLGDRCKRLIAAAGEIG